MIIRYFRARVHEGQCETFAKLFIGEMLPMMRMQEGVISANIGLPHPGSPTEFMMITRWESMDALKRFAGEDWQTAVIDPAEADLLETTSVEHFLCPEGIAACRTQSS